MSGTRLRLLLVLTGLLAGVVVAHSAAVGLLRESPHNDFGYLYVAGRTWILGLDPYGPGYDVANHQAAARPSFLPLWPFFYPPNWWPVATSLALLPFRAAAALWVIIGIVGMIAAQAIINRIFVSDRRAWLLPLLVAIAYTFASTGTVFDMWLGQTSPWEVIAYTLVLLGLIRRSDGLAGLGAALVMMKPNIGIILLAPLLLRSGGWKVLAIGAAIMIAATAPVFAQFGVGPTIKGFLNNLSHYEDVPANFPQAQTGLGTIIYFLSGLSLSPQSLPVVGATCAAVAYRSAVGHDRCPESELFVFMLAGIASAVFFARVHIHDLILVGLLIQPLMTRWSGRWPEWFAATGILLLLAPEKITNALNLDPGIDPRYNNFPHANLLASIAAGIVFVALIGAATSRRTHAR